LANLRFEKDAHFALLHLYLSSWSFSVSKTIIIGKGFNMITALVQFTLPQPISRQKAREVFSGSAQKYREIHGLIRKYYILSEDGSTAGGMYLWDSKEDAKLLYTEEWKQFIFDKYGVLPLVTYFECPVIVDNVIGEILTDED
jgi:hypothetical protein